MMNSMVNNKKDINALIEQQRSGFCLDQAFYNNDEIFKIDLERVLSRQWQFVDHESRMPNPGDYITYQFANESIIIVRDNNGELHAHFNVCRHRGSRICSEEQGNAKLLVCPYHAWVYELNGNLRGARQMPDDFNPDEYGLEPCRLEVIEGLVFININETDAADFQQLANNIRSFVMPHGLTKAKVAHTEKYTVNANWKLVIENFRECYHCSPSHPEYASVNAYVRIGDRELGGYIPVVDEWKAKVADSGREAGFKNFPYALQPHHAWRMPIKDGFKTATKDGSPAGPLMGDFKEYDCAETGVFFSALSYFYLNNDYATTFRITPISTNVTEVTINWLVDENAVEGTDYDVEHVKWLWDVTTIQDKQIVEENQIGVNSSRYIPGPYSKREYGTADFISWYLARLQGKQELRVVFRK